MTTVDHGARALAALSEANEMKAAGNLPLAVANYRRVLTLDPHNVAALYNLGNTLKQMGSTDEAVALYEKVIELQPLLLAAHFNLANTLREMHKPLDAVVCYRQVLSLNPDFVAAHSNLGLALDMANEFVEAIQSHEQAVRLAPEDAHIYINLAATLANSGQWGLSEQAYRRAVQLKPDSWKAYANLGGVLVALGRPQEGIACLNQAVTLAPDSPDANTTLLFHLAYAMETDGDYFLTEARKWEARLFNDSQRQRVKDTCFTRSPRHSRRLRVGYVSGDFREHAVSYFIEMLIKNHDKKRVETYAYSNHFAADASTNRISKAVDCWKTVAALSDAQLLEMIREDRIDILIDLSGHTRYNRLVVFQQRAAPVQAHYLGYFATTGLSEMDYWIADARLVSEETEKHFSETVWKLPRAWVAYTGRNDAPAIQWEPRADGSVWLGSFNNLAKLTDQSIALWSKIVLALPHAKLFLKAKGLDEPLNLNRIQAAFSAQGVPEDKLVLRGSTGGWVEHMTVYNFLDVALDPVGAHSGVTTTCDALWMGVPLVTLVGDRVAQRQGASLLSALGRSEWVAASEAEYLETVVKLAMDVPGRRTLRAAQREKMRQSSLCDHKGLAQALENAYEAMFDLWRKKSANDAQDGV